MCIRVLGFVSLLMILVGPLTAQTPVKVSGFFVEPFLEQQKQRGVTAVLQGMGPQILFTPDGITISATTERRERGRNQLQKSEQTLAMSWGNRTGKTTNTPLLQNALPTRFNDLRGAPQSRSMNRPTYEALMYPHLWPNIDLSFKNARGGTKFTLDLKPGANVSDIRFNLGANHWRMDEKGYLWTDLETSRLRIAKPRAYVMINDTKESVNARFRLLDNGSLGVELLDSPPVEYNVTIEAVLTVLTYFGTETLPAINVSAMTRDAEGNLYLTGRIRGAITLPTHALNSTPNGHDDIFVAKLDPAGDNILAFTYLGGEGQDLGYKIEVTNQGDVVVLGETRSEVFPISGNAFQSQPREGRNLIVVGLNSDLTDLKFGTYFDGLPQPDAGLAVGNDRICFTGERTPSTPLLNAQNILGEGFGACLDLDGERLIYSTALPRPGSNVLVTSANESIYIDDHLRKLSPSGHVLWERANAAYGLKPYAVAQDAFGNIYVGGSGDVNFIATPNAAMGTRDAHIPMDQATPALTKFDPNGSLIYASFLATSGPGQVNDIVIDAQSQAFAVGTLAADTLPLSDDAVDPRFRTTHMAFTARMNAEGSAINYATYWADGDQNQVAPITDAKAVLMDDGGLAMVGVSRPSQPNDSTPRTYPHVDKTLINVLKTSNTKMKRGNPFSGQEPQALTLDSNDNAILAGTTDKVGFPGNTTGVINGRSDVFVSKLDPDATTLLFTTMLGGNNEEIVHELATDPAGNIYVLMESASPDFGTARGGNTGAGAYIIKLDPNGGEVYRKRIADYEEWTWSGLGVTASGEVFAVGFVSREGIFLKLDPTSAEEIREETVLGEIYDLIVREQEVIVLNRRHLVRRNLDGSIIDSLLMPTNIASIAVGPGTILAATFIMFERPFIYTFDEQGQQLMEEQRVSCDSIALWADDLGTGLGFCYNREGVNGRFNLYMRNYDDNWISIFEIENQFSTFYYAANDTDSIAILTRFGSLEGGAATDGVYDDTNDFQDFVLFKLDACAQFTPNPVEFITVCEGRIFPMAMNVPAASYQWLRDGQIIPGATDRVLTLNRVAFEDNALFSCRLTFDCGREEVLDAYNITVLPKPFFLGLPRSQTADLGGSVTFSASATGTNGQIRYQWRKNLVNIEGATEPQLTLTNLCTQDAGAYTLAIQDDCNQGVISNVAVLTINTDLDLDMNPPAQAQGPQAAVFHANLPCFDQNGSLEVTTSPETPFQVAGQTITISPAPSENTTITATFTDASGVSHSTSGFLLIPPNPDFIDPDQDGCSGLADLLATLESWNTAGPDADGNGMINILDLIYFSPQNTCN